MTLLVNILLICLAWTCVQCSDQRDKLFFLQKSSGEDNETLLVVTWKESESEIAAGCEVFTDKGLIDEVLLSSVDAHIRKLSEDQMQTVISDCTEFTLRRRRRKADEEKSSDEELPEKDISDNTKVLRCSRNDNGQCNLQAHRNQDNNAGRPQVNEEESPTTTESPATLAYDGIPVIFPGTKWCGAGDRAKHYDDLGLHQDTDRCCRTHDHCNDTFAPGETKFNLTNKSPFTKLSCKCDLDFYDCLDRVNTVTSNTIGNTYFNLLKRECYQKEYPETKKCKKYRTLLKLSCIEYERDTKAPKVYQWISAKKYKKIPIIGTITVTLPF